MTAMSRPRRRSRHRHEAGPRRRSPMTAGRPSSACGGAAAGSIVYTVRRWGSHPDNEWLVQDFFRIDAHDVTCITRDVAMALERFDPAREVGVKLIRVGGMDPLVALIDGALSRLLHGEPAVVQHAVIAWIGPAEKGDGYWWRSRPCRNAARPSGSDRRRPRPRTGTRGRSPGAWRGGRWRGSSPRTWRGCRH